LPFFVCLVAGAGLTPFSRRTRIGDALLAKPDDWRHSCFLSF